MLAESAIAPWASQVILYRRRKTKFLGAKFQTDGTGTITRVPKTNTELLKFNVSVF